MDGQMKTAKRFTEDVRYNLYRTYFGNLGMWLKFVAEPFKEKFEIMPAQFFISLQSGKPEQYEEKINYLNELEEKYKNKFITE